MCGLAGVVRGAKAGSPLEPALKAMTAALAHRGPDDQGTWIDNNDGIAFGHRRLAIIDLSENGRQPMHSPDQRFVLTFNGEIYNHAKLRSQLEASGAKFKGRSDTEVLLYSLIIHGTAHTLERVEGMFAFAFYDRLEKKIVLARDRFGEKPLYYTLFDGALLFASELTSFRHYPGWTAEVDRNAIAEFVQFECIPAPHTIFHGVFKLEAAHALEIDISRWREGKEELTPRRYWQLDDEHNDSPVDEQDAIAETAKRLEQSVRDRMESDVPLGVFLSGGIDSSLITSIMQKHASRPVQSFTVAFGDKDYNEAPYAAAIARHLGTDHHEIFVGTQETIDTIPLLVDTYDEPFSDPSQIPSLIISHFTRKTVTVALTGDGADELFAGYNRYIHLPDIYNRLKKIPWPIKRMLANALRTVGIQRAANSYGFFAGRHGRQDDERQIEDKLEKLYRLLCLESPDAMYGAVRRDYTDTNNLVIGATVDRTSRHPQGGEDFVRYMMRSDINDYLQNDILVKLDRATMAASIEARSPFLDASLAQYAWNLPLRLKIRDNRGKWILRKLLEQHMPASLFERKKAGFAVPIGEWLRGPLRASAHDMLTESSLKKGGFLNFATVNRLWREHQRGVRNHQNILWSLFIFQQWLGKNSG